MDGYSRVQIFAHVRSSHSIPTTGDLLRLLIGNRFEMRKCPENIAIRETAYYGLVMLLPWARVQAPRKTSSAQLTWQPSCIQAGHAVVVVVKGRAIFPAELRQRAEIA